MIQITGMEIIRSHNRFVQSKGAEQMTTKLANVEKAGFIPEATLKKVARRKTFKRSDLRDTLAIAARESVKNNKDYYVCMTYFGYDMTDDLSTIPGTNPTCYILKGQDIYINNGTKTA